MSHRDASDLGGGRLGSVEVGLVGLVAASAIVVARAYPLWRDHLYVACPAWTIFGVPCPTCGATRAVVAAMRGDFLAALAWNPLAAIAALTAVLAIPATLGVLAGVLPAPTIPPRLSGSARLALAALLVANWVYLLRYFAG